MAGVSRGGGSLDLILSSRSSKLGLYFEGTRGGDVFLFLYQVH